MICSKCKTSKEILEFTVDRRRRSGYYPWCKPCKNKWTADNRKLRTHWTIAESKFCPKCEQDKDVSQFSKNKAQYDGLKPWCKNCCSNHAKKSYETPAKRNSYLKRHYNITLEEYNSLLEKQNFSCKICLKKCSRGNLSIDHDHTCCSGSDSCGKCIRGLLCRACNVGIGNLNHDPETLRKAAEYLTTHNLRMR